MENISKPFGEMLVSEVENYIAQYATLAESYYTLPIALWAMATHTWETFDTFPYLVITAYTKRSGKTRLMELIQPISANGRTFSPDSPSSMFRALDNDAQGENGGTFPSMFLDEAEKLNAENHPAREFLNKGYRKGQTITRTSGGDVKDFECFCPKCFVLIGDVYDTLKDRSIVVVMRRRTPVEAANSPKFRFDVVKKESNSLREKISEAVAANKYEIESKYLTGTTLDFLNDRDEEIWQSIFAMAAVFCPERMEELTQTAVDMCMEKMAPSRKAYGEDWEKAEKEAEENEAQVLLLRDILKLAADKGDEQDFLVSTLADELKAIPTAQWRKYKGEGLTQKTLGYLLGRMGIQSSVQRKKGTSGRNGKTGDSFRIYRLKDLHAAAILCGLIEQ